MATWKLVNSENVEPFVCDDVYSSKMLTGDEMAGHQVININEGTLKPGGTTRGSGRGGVHEETEIYYIIEGEGDVVLDDVPVPVKAEDIIVIPGGTWHWIDNSRSDKPFRLFTLWPKQEQNGVFHERLKAWGTSVKYIDGDYTEKRVGGKKFMVYNMADCYIGVEIGASKVQAALGYEDGSLVSVSRHAVVLEDGARGILNWLAAEIPAMIAGKRVAAIGVGFGGILESSTGVSLVSVQVDGWKDFPLKDWFEKTFGLPVVVLNDTVAGGCGEYLCSKEKTDVFFYTNIGSGIGGCLLLRGRYFDGSGYGGAYFGHTYVPDRTAGADKAYAKVETLCSGFGIERRLNSPGYVPESSLLYKLGQGNSSLEDPPAKRPRYSCAMLGEAARKQDPFALEEIERTADSYALGLSNVITLFGAETVVIGGGVAKLGDLLLDPIRRQTEKYVFISAANRYTIRQSVLMDDAVLTGSIAAAAGKVGCF